MASKNDEDIYNDDEDDEGDFVPGGDDDDDDDDVAYDEDEEDDEDFPSLLQGDLHLDNGRVIVYDDAQSQNQSFRLASQDPAPSTWTLQSPLLTKSTVFVGWIQDRAKQLTFDVHISKMESAIDPLEQRFLDAQKQKLSERQGKGKSEDEDSKPLPNEKQASKKASLKEPPAYSLKQSPDGDKGSDQSVYVLDGVSRPDGSGSTTKLRGLFHQPGNHMQRLFLMTSIQVGQEASPAKPQAAAAAAAAPASRKRGRGNAGDDELVDNDDGVEYQELIDLHDDAGLSTEELRKRYYGGQSDEGNKKPKPSEDDDDDDAYGF